MKRGPVLVPTAFFVLVCLRQDLTYFSDSDFFFAFFLSLPASVFAAGRLAKFSCILNLACERKGEEKGWHGGGVKLLRLAKKTPEEELQSHGESKGGGGDKVFGGQERDRQHRELKKARAAPKKKVKEKETQSEIARRESLKKNMKQGRT